jgi:hypothetical protein
LAEVERAAAAIVGSELDRLVPQLDPCTPEWLLPAVGFAVFANGGLVSVDPYYVGMRGLQSPPERVMAEWVVDAGLSGSSDRTH